MHLTPQAAERMAREAATQTFDPAAKSLNADWGTHYDGKQIQRWAEHIGGQVVAIEERERMVQSKGRRPEGPANAPDLLVIGMDGGRVQERDKDPDTKSRWHEDKVLTVSSYQRGAPQEPGGDPELARLVTTYVATMQNSDHFRQLARVEAERRGIRQAKEAVVMGDGGSWIDTVGQEQFACHTRIIDFAHVNERLSGCAKAIHPVDEKKRGRLAGRLESHLYNGKTKLILRWLERQHKALGTPRDSDPEEHPRRVLQENLIYMQRHQHQMDYPAYRAKGWPIGSGVTESGVKLFNKRVKGTEQFWSPSGVESIMALRAMWLSQDDRWLHYWLCGELLRQAA